jgi:hypothetical protein
MRKKLPSLKSDAAAERFVTESDLRDYDLSVMVPVRFELKRKDKSVSLRLPEQLLRASSSVRGGQEFSISASSAWRSSALWTIRGVEDR